MVVTVGYLDLSTTTKGGIGVQFPLTERCFRFNFTMLCDIVGIQIF